jgi:hypothetical protein
VRTSGALTHQALHRTAQKKRAAGDFRRWAEQVLGEHDHALFNHAYYYNHINVLYVLWY